MTTNQIQRNSETEAGTNTVVETRDQTSLPSFDVEKNIKLGLAVKEKKCPDFHDVREYSRLREEIIEKQVPGRTVADDRAAQPLIKQRDTVFAKISLAFENLLRSDLKKYSRDVLDDIGEVDPELAERLADIWDIHEHNDYKARLIASGKLNNLKDNRSTQPPVSKPSKIVAVPDDKPLIAEVLPDDPEMTVNAVVEPTGEKRVLASVAEANFGKEIESTLQAEVAPPVVEKIEPEAIQSAPTPEMTPATEDGRDPLADTPSRVEDELAAIELASPDEPAEEPVGSAEKTNLDTVESKPTTTATKLQNFFDLKSRKRDLKSSDVSRY